MAVSSCGKLLITRPRTDAERLAATLLDKNGISCVISPMLEIVGIPGATDEISSIMNGESPPAAVIVTSHHALPILSAVKACLTLHLFIVGSRTAEQAANLGFTSVHPPADNAENLVKQITETRTANKNPLLYAAGEHISMDIKAVMEGNGYEIRQITAYKAQAATVLPAEAISAIGRGEIFGVLFYSRRTVKIFADLANKAGLLPHIAHITAFCLSDKIASSAGSLLPFRDIIVSPSPDEDSLLSSVRNALEKTPVTGYNGAYD